MLHSEASVGDQQGWTKGLVIYSVVLGIPEVTSEPCLSSVSMSPSGQKGGHASLQDQGIPKSWQKPGAQRGHGKEMVDPIALTILIPALSQEPARRALGY